MSETILEEYLFYSISPQFISNFIDTYLLRNPLSGFREIRRIVALHTENNLYD